MNEKIADTLEVILTTIFTGFGGYIFVKDLFNIEEDGEEEE